jgi:5-methyltetrahydropteroyltriglutamate--homocysteine methyltransferase
MRYSRWAMTRRTQPPFRADHVGSFLRPQALLEARDRHFKKNEITRAQLREVWARV